MHIESARQRELESDRRLRLIREAMSQADIDAVVVCGSEYTGFEGAVRYVSGFLIVHRYAYVLIPLEADPVMVFPAEARYVGSHQDCWIDEQVFAEHPGEWLAEQLRGRRVGVYGLDFVMTVRDFRALERTATLVPFDVEFDLARAVKSDPELDSVRESVRINRSGFWIFLGAFAPGKREQDVMALCERYFVGEGCGRLTMDMVLVGDGGSAKPEFKVASDRRIAATDLVLPSLEIAGPGGHWVEVSRPIIAGRPSKDTERMMEAYGEYHAVACEMLRPGVTAHEVHRAIAAGFVSRGYKLGHVTGHSIGMTMIEHPRIGEGVETPLEEDMVLSLHPHALTDDGATCLYMQDTWLVSASGGVALAGLPLQLFRP
jgi:Xaa-Pro dipeptidase